MPETKPAPVDIRTLASPAGASSLKNWVAGLVPSLPKEIDKTLVSTAQDIFLIAADEASATLKKGEKFHIRAELVPILDHLLWAIAMIVKGKRFVEIENTTGISWTRLRAAAGVDRNGFGMVYTVALREREEAQKEFSQEHLRLKAKEGVIKPVVIRNGRDHDEIRMVTVDSEALIAKAADAGRMRDEKSETKNTTNIGQAITYNIEAPQFILKNEPLKLIETNPLEGLKKSLE